MATDNKIFVQKNNERVELTGQELNEFLAERAEVEAQYEAEQQQRLEREAKLESAINKLKSLGLTESEAKIIIGLE